MKLKNNTAIFGWGFSACFLAACGIFTYILVRDGSSHIQISPPEIPEYYPAWFMPLVLAVFWAAGIGLARYVSKIPCLTLEVYCDNSVIITSFTPFSRKVAKLESWQTLPAVVVEGSDSDGDPYFTVRLETVNGMVFNIAEGNDKNRCAEIASRFNEETGKTGQTHPE